MKVTALHLQQFRNYKEERFSFDDACNVICGENAQGKTNLLEAIAYLSAGRSPRTRGEKEMISFDSDEACIEADIFVRERDYRLRTELRRGRAKKVTVNGVSAKDGVKPEELLSSVYFCPDDLLLIRQGAAERRRFLDTALCQLRPRYAKALSRYGRAYESKTRILRDSTAHPDLLAALPEFNEQIALYGAVLIHYRAAFARRLEEYACAVHSECSGSREHLSVCYQTVKTVTDTDAPVQEIARCLREHLARHEEAERAAMLCLSGPHKDDLSVSIDGRSAKAFSSQGQTRTAALSLKLAEREIFYHALGEYPVLLLDDVLSELDPRRQEFVLNRIAGGQVFITCCEDDRLEQLLKGKVFRIHGGCAVQEKKEC